MRIWIDVTPAESTPDFELWCVACGASATNPMWWDAGDGAWYCGTHGWVGNPCTIRFVYDESKARFFNSPVWMPNRVGIPERPEAPEGFPVCRVCGCWECCACVGGCYWIEKDLCSSCVGGRP